MPSDDADAFQQSPEYFASLIIAILRHFKQSSVTLSALELKETAPLSLHVVGGTKDGQSLLIEVIANPDAQSAVEEFVGLDYASSPLPDRNKLN